MNRLVVFLTFIASVIVAHASCEWNLQGGTYFMDTINHVKVGPSTTLTSLRLTGSQNLNVFYTTTDLTNPLLDIKVLKAKNTIFARQEVSEMAIDNDNDSSQFFLGVNADFFNMRRGNSIGSQISNGKPIYVDNNGRTQWACTENCTPIMDQMNIKCVVKAGNNIINLSGVNVEENINDINLYTPLYGKQTDSNSNVLEIAVVPIDADIAIGKSTRLRVETNPKTGGNMPIPNNGYVISGSGRQCLLMRQIKKGDILEFSSSINLSNGAEIHPTEVVSGYPVILQDGVTTNPVDILKHLNGLHPRTAVGNSADGSKLIILIVDGRSEISDGCTSKVLADIMRYVGCDDAINLDGGGSSELYVKELGICNIPSDGEERTVANGLYVVANVPTDNELASIEIANSKTPIKIGENYVPVVYGYNKYGILIDTNVKGVKLSADKKAGKIAKKGTTLNASKEGKFIITVQKNGLTSQSEITIVK